MAIEDRSTLKGHFETGDTPTEAQFSNLIDSYHHKSDAAEQSTSSTLSFHNAFSGVIHGTWSTPITGTLTIDETNAVDGGCVCVIWSGSSNPTITGGVINVTLGNINSQGVYSIYFHRIAGRYNINILVVDSAPPATPTLVSVYTPDSVDPATPVLNSVVYNP